MKCLFLTLEETAEISVFPVRLLPRSLGAFHLPLRTIQIVLRLGEVLVRYGVPEPIGDIADRAVVIRPSERLIGCYTFLIHRMQRSFFLCHARTFPAHLSDTAGLRPQLLCRRPDSMRAEGRQQVGLHVQSRPHCILPVLPERLHCLNKCHTVSLGVVDLLQERLHLCIQSLMPREKPFPRPVCGSQKLSEESALAVGDVPLLLRGKVCHKVSSDLGILRYSSEGATSFGFFEETKKI